MSALKSKVGILSISLSQAQGALTKVDTKERQPIVSALKKARSRHIHLVGFLFLLIFATRIWINLINSINVSDHLETLSSGNHGVSKSWLVDNFWYVFFSTFFRKLCRYHI